MQNLPKSPEIRCYFYCGWIEYKLMKRGSTTFYPSTLFDLMEEMTEEEQKKYFKLIRGCAKRISRIKDPVEVSYQARVCEKENDPDVRILDLFICEFDFTHEWFFFQLFYIFYWSTYQHVELSTMVNTLMNASGWENRSYFDSCKMQNDRIENQICIYMQLPLVLLFTCVLY